MSTTTPKPINTAPRDGRSILSDCGIVRLMNQEQWGSPVPHGNWVLCYPDGNIISDSDNGPEICTPKLWVPLPKWIPR